MVTLVLLGADDVFVVADSSNQSALSAIRLKHFLSGGTSTPRRTVAGNDDQEGGPGPSNNNEARPGPSGSPGMMVDGPSNRIMSLTPPLQLRPPPPLAAPTTSSQPSSSTPSPRTLGQMMGRMAARHRRPHFQDTVSFENRLQRMRERLQQQRQMRHNEQYRNQHPKDVYCNQRSAHSPVLSSSLASLRSMMRCGNNPDWLKLSGQNRSSAAPVARWITPAVTTGPTGPSHSSYTIDHHWRVENPTQEAATNLSVASTSGGDAQPPNEVEAPLPEAPASPRLPEQEVMLPEPVAGPSEEATAEETAPDVAAPPAKRARTDDSATHSPENALNSSILSMLECPVCLEHMGPPIHQCRRGHLVCNSCRAQLQTCPTCRSRFTDLRNLALERIAELLLFPCKNDQCGQSFQLGSKEVHELNCPWRVYSCMAQNCQWQGLHKSLLAHVQEQHSELILVGASHRLEMPLDITFSRNYVFSAWGELFRANMQRGPNNNAVHSLAQYLGPVTRAAEFCFTFKMEKKDTAGVARSIRFERSMHTDNIRLSQVYASGDAFCVGVEQAKHFTSDRKTILQIQLEKVAPPRVRSVEPTSQ